MKSSCLIVAAGAALALAAAACTDVGDSSFVPLDAAALDRTAIAYDATSNNDEGGDDASVAPGSDGAAPPFDAHSIVESGELEGGGPDAATADATADVTIAETGAADTGTHDSGPPDVGIPDAAALDPHCATNNGGSPCTATELLFIGHDTTPDGRGKGGATAFACYDCMVLAGCLDDALFSTDKDHECGDTGGAGITQPTLSGDDATASCLDVVSCVLGNGCVDGQGSGTCYCGSAVGANCTMPGKPNGSCLAQEQDGLAATDPVSVNSRFSNISYAGGMANTLFGCAVMNSCTACN